MDRCPQCHTKNHLRALFCNQCGVKLMEDRAAKDLGGRAKLYADIAHPINSECRDLIQETVLEAYSHEQELAKQPDYVCRYDDYDEESLATLRLDEAHEPPNASAALSGEQRSTSVSSTHTATANSRRVESATEEGLAGPHHRARGRDDSSRTIASTARDDDAFGAGII